MGRGALWIALFAAAIVLLFPLRMALGVVNAERLGLSAREARGPVWAGRLIEARWRGLALGDLDASLSPVQLLVGRVRLDLSGDGDMRGAVSVSRNGAGIDDVSGRLPVEGLFEGLPLGALIATDVSARFADGVCDRAEGQVRAELSAALPGVSLAQGMTGRARCDGGALLLPLQGASGLERLDLRLFGDGRWQARLQIAGDGAALSAGVLERSGRL
ncbi:type II secretion system protein N [Sphingomonas gilva]|uniref:Type II secretion system protein N n=2 Tax=Sphingomonas gilva TaxID=2305907 RepID=A0A396RMR0_9SPHN|nr:type II secretion system protein N [Sphingomonas gilva]